MKLDCFCILLFRFMFGLFVVSDVCVCARVDSNLEILDTQIPRIRDSHIRFIRRHGMEFLLLPIKPNTSKLTINSSIAFQFRQHLSIPFL